MASNRKDKKISKKDGGYNGGKWDDSASPSRAPLPPSSPVPVDLQLPTPVNTATRDQVSQHAMIASIIGGTFEDVKFYAFSRRTRSGIVDTPRSLFGNSSLIRKASSHFDFVLTRGFAESGLTDMDTPFPRNRSAYTQDYDYTSDSDLEDEPEREPLEPADSHDVITRPSSSSADAEGPPKTGSRAGGVEDEEESAEDTSEHVAEKAGTSSTGGDTSASNCSHRRGRVVFVEDVAYRTWQAFIFYAYFGKVSFTPLKSQEQAEATVPDLYGLPSCSPKSMYRLAEKYGIEELKIDAAKDIASKLTNNNILTELFSSFTLLHPEIKTLETSYLHEHIRDPVLLSRIPRWFQYLERGELPDGAADVFSSLVNKLVAGDTAVKKCPRGCGSSFRCNNCSYTFN